MQPAIFLDRDGVICENRAEYVRSWEDVAFIPGALQALARLAALPARIIIVSNQSGVGRGVIPLETAQDVHRRIVEVVQSQGGRIDDSFLCFHAPEEACNCRKPAPGLLLAAADTYELDLRHSLMIGDAWTDLAAGRAAGVRNSVLLLSGRGKQQAKLGSMRKLAPIDIYTDLSEFTAHLLATLTRL